MDIGIPITSMIRLGGKSTDRTKPLTIKEQASSKLTPSQWKQINKLESRLLDHEKRLSEAFKRYQNGIQKAQLMDHLEFASEDLPFFEAFTVPAASHDGMTIVGKKNKTLNPLYLLDRWLSGYADAGALAHIQPARATRVWNMSSKYVSHSHH